VLQRARIDGVEGDPGIGLEEDDEVAGGLLQAERHATRGILGTHLGQPVVEPFWRVERVRLERWPVWVSMRCRSALASERSRPMTRSKGGVVAMRRE